MDKTIDMTFIRLMVEKKGMYYISLGNVFGWFNEPYTFREYITNGEYKQEFDNKYLFGCVTDNKLQEAGSDNDLEADYVFRTLYNVSFPYFSSSGFKSLCIMFDTPRTHYVKNVFNLVEHTYLYVISDDSDDYINLNIDGNSRIMEKIKKLFLKVIVDYNNRPIRQSIGLFDYLIV